MDYDSYRRPAIQIIHSTEFGFSRFGGLPTVPADFVWPTYENAPLALLLQLDLAEVAESGTDLGLPDRGSLYFFYDQEQSTWGSADEDLGSWRVLYIDRSESDLQEVEPPEGLEIVYPTSHVQFRSVSVYPSPERIPGSDDWYDDDMEAYIELKDSIFGTPDRHYMGGYPDPIQDDDMESQCDLSFKDGDDHGNSDAKSRWKLLLQLDSDNKVNFMWGDVGRLYFFIRNSDLAVRNFDNVWMVLQCS